MLSSFFRRIRGRFVPKDAEGIKQLYQEQFEVKREINDTISKEYNHIINFNLLKDMNLSREFILNKNKFGFFYRVIYLRSLLKINHNVTSI